MATKTKNALCGELKQYPNMPIFVQHRGRNRDSVVRVAEGFYDPNNTTMIWRVQDIDEDTTNYKPCLILY